MELFYFTDKEELDEFIKNAADTRGAEFLQSWQWGELLKSGKAEILRVGVNSDNIGDSGQTDKKNILAAAMIIKKPLGGGYQYLYSPRGPIFKSGLTEEQRRKTADFLYGEIRKLNPRAVFLRIEPNEPNEPIIAETAAGSGEKASNFKIKKTFDLQPRQTLLLDLALSEEMLLKSMHQKTRYNINLALKKDVEIKEGSVVDFSEFWRLMNLTGARDGFRLHDADHYLNLLSEPKEDGLKTAEKLKKTGSFRSIRLFFASYQGRNIAAGLFCFWGDKATYLHGASDNDFRNVMAPYLLQWTMIKRAREDGYKYYDFYGIDEKKWPGVTRFKFGFGGRVENYPGTFDVILSPVLYGFYGLIRKLKRLI